MRRPVPSRPAASSPKPAASLTPFELENGIGPISEKIKLDPLNPELAERGEILFETKCSACHKPAERYVGPAMAGITKKRSPEYILNMILNPEEMIRRHPEANRLFKEYLIPMTFQNLSEEDARALLEYLRGLEEIKSEVSESGTQSGEDSS